MSLPRALLVLAILTVHGVVLFAVGLPVWQVLPLVGLLSAFTCSVQRIPNEAAGHTTLDNDEEQGPSSADEEDDQIGVVLRSMLASGGGGVSRLLQDVDAQSRAKVGTEVTVCLVGDSQMQDLTGGQKSFDSLADVRACTVYLRRPRPGWWQRFCSGKQGRSRKAAVQAKDVLSYFVLELCNLAAAEQFEEVPRRLAHDPQFLQLGRQQQADLYAQQMERIEYDNMRIHHGICSEQIRLGKWPGSTDIYGSSLRSWTTFERYWDASKDGGHVEHYRRFFLQNGLGISTAKQRFNVCRVPSIRAHRYKGLGWG